MSAEVICGHNWCEGCARQELAARELQAARDRAHRPGATFATNANPGNQVYQNPEILHAAHCPNVIHPEGGPSTNTPTGVNYSGSSPAQKPWHGSSPRASAATTPAYELVS